MAISEITQVPSNVQVIKILNELIKRYNSLGSIYTFKGSVQTYDDLLAIQNPNVGDVYNVVQEDEEHQIAAGSNFVWDGTVWDNLGGSLAGLVQSVNGINPDSLGNVLLPLIKNVSISGGNIAFTKNNNTNVNVDNVKKLYVFPLGENVDLNALTEAGIYICGNNSYAANYENCPIQKAFLLEVQANDNSSMIWQFLTQYNDGSTEAGNQYTRTYYDNNWSAWRMAGSGSNLTFYTSLEQLGITPGQESFASIHSALPINSVLEYYVYPNSNFNYDMYPAPDIYGNIICSKTTDTNTTQFIFTQNKAGSNTYQLIVYVTTYNTVVEMSPQWQELAKQSDLTDLSDSLGAAAYKNLAYNDDFLGRVPLIGYDGVMEIGQHIDFHIKDSTQTDFDVRIQALSNDLAVRIPSLNKTISLVALANSSSWTISKGTNGWARESSTGFTIQWGFKDNLSAGDNTISFPRTFSTVYQVVPSFQGTGNYENSGFTENSNPTKSNFKVWVRYGGECRWIATGLS